MAEETGIEWCDSTFNPWIGCKAISPGCKNCYAAALAKRTGRDFDTPTRTSEANWKQVLRWERVHDAFFALHGRRRRVFCASMADVFDNAVDPAWRADLFWLIRQTPNLDWLLLTKRIGNAASMMREAAVTIDPTGEWPLPWPNVWLGATVVNQEEADRDIPKLIDVPARVRFLSIEPMLGPIDLAPWLIRSQLDWVIVGGESGTGARPMHPDWARNLRNQCQEGEVPFLFKQWGEWSGHSIDAEGSIEPPMHMNLRRIIRWDGAMPREVGPEEPAGEVLAEGTVSSWIGKKAAGRLLDGVMHDGYPEVRP
jgi:protein gp37